MMCFLPVKISLYEVEDSSKMMNALRYSEVHQVNIEQLKLLMELLNELANCGGIASQDISETKVLNSFTCNINE